ncbi:hypothetical protein BDN72DRAFT_759417 [Pluteus cervinus]|uniref:Uncharacterized protein n=1 Tax=Pluteus cervinus TaxID=181527 RepID=A0ACD3BA64_9AGAR|nr:hypothetical protein BDN72DRAFT_759417 [Pluteus cervinus]
MLPFKFRKDIATGSASPSISMEKGTYRMRAPPLPRLPLSPHPKRALSPQTRRSQHDPNAIPTPMLMLIGLLVFACISSFGFAYYLFTTRWEAQLEPPKVPSHRLAIHDNNDTVTRVDMNHFQSPLQNYTEHEHEERFLAYLPHSGFHNQRVALENALILAHILNRTLLVPDARLGGRPIPYLNFTRLYEASVSAEATNLDCITTAGPKTTPGCSPVVDTSVYVQWDHLVDWQSIASYVRTTRRPTISTKWIEDSLGVPPAEIAEIHDSSLYQYCILEGDDAVVPDKCSEPIYVDDLLEIGERVIYFGSLFGFSRISLRSPHYMDVRRRIRRGMVLKNQELLQAANGVVEHIGGAYLAVHLRLLEKFEPRQYDILRATWWEIVRGVLQFSTSEAARLEEDFGFFNSTGELDVETREIPSKGARTRRPSRVDLDVLRPSGHRALQACSGRRHIAAPLALLNTPLFIATDIPNPRYDSTLQAFRRTFPCAYFLSDFTNIPLLGSVVLPGDGVVGSRVDVFLPLVDAIVAGKAVAVVGTMGSTFSAFVQDILWPSYHQHDVMVVS